MNRGCCSSMASLITSRGIKRRLVKKVSYWETESDKVSTRLQRAIFNKDDLHLSQKLQLRDFVMHVDKIADRAEDVSDKLSIYVIKRSL